jgi:hypothetical protein
MRFFETKFLEEVDDFISQLDPKTIRKIFYNIEILTLLNRQMTQNFSRNFRMTFGSFGQSSQDFKSDCLHFGTKQIKKKLWS